MRGFSKSRATRRSRSTGRRPASSRARPDGSSTRTRRRRSRRGRASGTTTASRGRLRRDRPRALDGRGQGAEHPRARVVLHDPSPVLRAPRHEHPQDRRHGQRRDHQAGWVVLAERLRRSAHGPAKGYVLAPMISDGEFRDDVGGGVSQFATTMFNAIFFGGYRFNTHRPHSYYISRYPRVAKPRSRGSCRTSPSRTTRSPGSSCARRTRTPRSR